MPRALRSLGWDVGLSRFPEGRGRLRESRTARASKAWGSPRPHGLAPAATPPRAGSPAPVGKRVGDGGRLAASPSASCPPAAPSPGHRDKPRFAEGKTEAQGARRSPPAGWEPGAQARRLPPDPPVPRRAVGGWGGAPPGPGVPGGDSEEMVSSLTSCALPRSFRPRVRSRPHAPSHSNSWRRRQPSPPSPRSRCRRRPSSLSTAASCRSSTTRTG